MKNYYSILITVLLLCIFSACTDDELSQECVTCDVTEITYCINQGANFYTIIDSQGAETDVLLNGEFWSNIIAQFEAECGNQINEDCFTCNAVQTEYCYIEGNDFYTLEVEGEEVIEILLGDNDWQTIKDAFIENCTDAIIDCYTCVSEATEYCYTEGDAFYTTTLNGTSTETELNGQTWEEIRVGLESNCPTEQTASIVGVWNLTNYVFTTQTVTIISGNAVNTSSITIGITYNSTENYTENPNESTGEGISILQTTVTDENGEEIVFDDVELEILDATFWEINGNQLTKTSDGENATVEILELTETTLKYKGIISFDDEDIDGNPQTNTWEEISTFTRQ